MSDHVVCSTDTNTNACVYGCLLVFAQRTPHIQSSTILQSRTFCCPFIRPIIYFVWALKLPLFWLYDNVFFCCKKKKIDSLNIYLTTFVIQRVFTRIRWILCIFYFFLLVSNDFIHCTLLFKI